MTYRHPSSVRGSSPLARGLHYADEIPAAVTGIIPARAGFTPRRTRRPSQKTDHPRSRGVYQEVSRTEYKALGSSPLARGLLRHQPHDLGDVGIIPARAGFT